MTQCPSTYEEAMISRESREWNIAIKNEIKNMYDKKVMTVVNTDDIPKNSNIIDTRWVLVIKGDNTKKARLIAKGYQQKEGKDFISTYSPTAQSDSLRITIAIASLNKWNLKQLDIKAAYLNADLNEKIYIKIPKVDRNYNKNKEWLLKKALYGLKQAGRMWNEEITNFLKSIGLKQYKSDKCLFGKYNKENKLIGLLTLYVDDILITGEDYKIKIIINKLKK